jgi:hypothetical protein
MHGVTHCSSAVSNSPRQTFTATCTGWGGRTATQTPGEQGGQRANANHPGPTTKICAPGATKTIKTSKDVQRQMSLNYVRQMSARARGARPHTIRVKNRPRNRLVAVGRAVILPQTWDNTQSVNAKKNGLSYRTTFTAIYGPRFRNVLTRSSTDVLRHSNCRSAARKLSMRGAPPPTFGAESRCTEFHLVKAGLRARQRPQKPWI